MSRDAFLARVRQAAEMGRAYRVHLQDVPEDIAYVGVNEDLVERFAAEVDAVGGQSYIVEGTAGVHATLSRLVEEAGATSALCWQHELLDAVGLSEFLKARGIARHDLASLASIPPDEQRRIMLGCGIGITSCDLAIAETGTLMMCSRPGQERAASLLPPYYVTIVERRQIVADLVDAFRMLQRSEVRDQKSERMSNDQAPMTNEIRNPKSEIRSLPSNVTFITGPSKTGDIELQLTTGVHGPGRWRVIVVNYR
jgi:L-lactate dehydrogenase complex protein LldG